MATVKGPSKLRQPWLGVWRAAQRQIEEAGAWSEPLRPLLDEYVEALRRARELRPPAGADAANAGFVAADRETRRAVQLAAALGLTPKRPVGRPRTKPEEPDAPQATTPADAFAELDELAPRRKRAQAAGQA